MTAVLLAVVVLCGTLAGSYEEAQATGVAVSYGIVEILESFFMSLGLTIGLKDLIDNSDLQKKLDEWMKSDYDRIYEKYMQSYPNLPDQTPSPIPSPEITQTPTEDTDEQLPATYEQLKEQAAADGVLEMVPATFFCLATAVQDLWDNIMGCVNNVDSSLDEDTVNMILGSGFPYYLYYVTNNGVTSLYFGGIGSYIVNDGKYGSLSLYRYLAYENGKKRLEGSGALATNASMIYKVWYSNLPQFSNSDEAYAWSKQQRANNEIYQKENYWPSTDLKDDYDNNTSPDFPSIVVPPVIRVPTLDEIKELLQQGNDDEENRPVYVTDFITNHTIQPTPSPNPTESPEANPSPTVAVVPNPDGSSSTDPNPTGSPDPDGSTSTDTNPTGSPDPDGSTSTDPNPTGSPTEQTPEEAASPYKADLREVFPFCIPFDLIHLLKAFEAEAEAPVFEFPLDLELNNPWTGEKVVDYHHTFKLDMSDYEPVIKILRIFQVVFFIIALMLITRQQMIKG